MKNSIDVPRGIKEIIPQEEFFKKIETGEQLTFYVGVDPTGPDIHIGHAVLLRALRKFQQMGHRIILLIGDFTARIGDPTDKDAARVALTQEEVIANANSYQKQAAKILDFEDSKNPAIIDYNSRWLDELTFQDVIELSAEFTVQQMVERDMFEKRLQEGKPVYVHEFLYPIMQGYDSVALNVDVECGGTDQLFNMLAGRTLLKNHSQKEKIVITCDLLEGLDGRKMSKSYGNTVNLNDSPKEMFGKIMSLSDELIPRYFTLATDVSDEYIANVEKRMRTENPRDIKMELAQEIVTLYHDSDAAISAKQAFFDQFTEKKIPQDIPTYQMVSGKTTVLEILLDSGSLQSKSEGRRLLQQGGIRINDTKATQEDQSCVAGDVIQIGKRRFLQLF